MGQNCRFEQPKRIHVIGQCFEEIKIESTLIKCQCIKTDKYVCIYDRVYSVIFYPRVFFVYLVKYERFRSVRQSLIYKRIRLFDDDTSNLKALLNLQSDYNDVDFEAWKADDKGRIKKVK